MTSVTNWLFSDTVNAECIFSTTSADEVLTKFEMDNAENLNYSFSATSNDYYYVTQFLLTADDKITIKKQLLYAAQSGNLDDFIIYSDVFLDDTNTLQEGLRTACKAEHLNIVKWLYEQVIIVKNTPNFEQHRMFSFTLDFFHLVIQALLTVTCKTGHIETLNCLLENLIADFNFINDYGDSVLAIASERGHLEIAKILFQKLGINVNLRYGRSKNTLLHYASKRGNFDIMNYLLEKNTDIDVDLLNDDGDSAVSIACERGHLEIVKCLLPKSTVDINVPYGWSKNTLLLKASEGGNLEIVKYLLENQANIDVNLLNDDGDSAVSIACEKGNLGIVKCLLPKSIDDINVRYGRSKNTLLLKASKRGNLEIVKYLLKNHADIDVDLLNDDGDSAVSVACELGPLEIAACLLPKSRVDINVRYGWSKNTLLLKASKEGNLLIVKYLLENHVDIDVSLLNNDGDSAVCVACEKGNLEIAKLLWRKSEAHVNLCYGRNKNTLLQYASKGGNSEIVKYILENHSDIDVDLLNDDGGSAVSVACEKGNFEIVKLLWPKSGVDVNRPYGRRQNTLLKYASKKGTVEIVKYLLENHKDINVDLLNVDGDTAVSIACGRGHCEIVKCLLPKSRVDVNVRYGKSKNTLLLKASERGNSEIVKYLLENQADINVDLPNDDGDSAVSIACGRGHLEMAKCLLPKSRVDINVRYGKSENTLLLKASEGKNLNIVKYLLENHADVDVDLLNDDDNSAVSVACEKGNLEIVKCLLPKSRVDINLRYGRSENTLLLKASERGNSEIVKYLLENYADIDVDLLNDDGDSAVSIACERGHFEIVKRLLPKSRVDINVRYGRKNTLLLKASEGGNLKIMKYILKNHADIDVDLLNVDGDSAVSIACEKGHLEIAICLLPKSRVDINLRYGRKKNTLLLKASKEGKSKIVKYLLESHADVDVDLLNDDGDSAVSIACSRGHSEIIRCLRLKSRVDVNLRYGKSKNTLLLKASERGNLLIVKYLLGNHADIDVDLPNDYGDSAVSIACNKGNFELVKVLWQKSGVDVNFRYGRRQNTLLQYASENGTLEIVKYLLENHADIDVDLLNGDANSAVSIACGRQNLEIVKCLLPKSSVDINLRYGKSKNTLLLKATEKGTSEIVKYLLENHADIDVDLLKDGDDSALSIACRRGSFEKVKCLLAKSKVDINLRYGKSKNTLLLKASQRGNLEIVKYLLENQADIDVDLPNNDGNSAVSIACELGPLEIVKCLLPKSRVDINQRYGKRKNVLLHYASENGTLEIVKYLLENHADIDVNLFNDDGDSAVSIACERENLEIIKCLLPKSSVDINLRYGRSKNTLLHKASEKGTLEIVKYLLENHADIDVNLLNDDGDSAVSIACNKGNFELVKLLGQKLGVDVNFCYGRRQNTLLQYASENGTLKIVKYLLENHADIDVDLRNDYGVSAVSIACERGHLEIFKLLWRKSRVDVNLRYGWSENTLLHFASKGGNLKMVKYLLDNHADIDVNLLNNFGESAVSIACEKGNFEIVKLLLQKSGVDVNFRNCRRKVTPLQYASEKGNLKIEKYFLENQADIDVDLLNDDGDSAVSKACERGNLEIVNFLLPKSRVDINVRYGWRKNTLLLQATENGYSEIVKYLLENHADIDVDLLNDDGDSAVSIACERENLEIVNCLLLKSRVDVNVRYGGSQNTLLLKASEGRNLKIVKYLLENHVDIDVNLLNNYGDSAVSIACEKGHLEIVKYLLPKSRVDINLRYGRSENTLLLKASKTGNSEIVKYLLENYADVDVDLLNDDGDSAVSIECGRGQLEIAKCLLQKSRVDINVRYGKSKNTLLLKAREGGNLEIVKYLLENHADINVDLLNDDGDSCVSKACEKGPLEIIKCLLPKSRVDINVRYGIWKDTLLLKASEKCNWEIVRHLLENHADIDVNLRNYYGDSAVCVACKKGNFEIVKLLWQKSGVDVNLFYCWNNNTLLHYANRGGNLKIVKYLLENHADIDVNMLNDHVESAVSIACEKGNFEIVKLLWQKSGVDVNLRYCRKNTLLQYASEVGNLKTVKYLLDNHADIDVDLLNDDGDSAVSIACERGYSEIAKCLLPKSRIDMNVRYGRSKETLLLKASKRGNLKIVKYLLENHADNDVNLRNVEGDSAVSIACERGNFELVKLLWQNSGVDVNLRYGKRRSTLLHFASKGGNLKIVKYLLENHTDIDVDLLNDNGDSALAVASKKACLDIVKYLVQKNADVNFSKKVESTALLRSRERTQGGTLKYFSEKTNVDENLKNKYGHSALEVLECETDPLKVREETEQLRITKELL